MPASLSVGRRLSPRPGGRSGSGSAVSVRFVGGWESRGSGIRGGVGVWSGCMVLTRSGVFLSFLSVRMAGNRLVEM